MFVFGGALPPQEARRSPLPQRVDVARALPEEQRDDVAPIAEPFLGRNAARGEVAQEDGKAGRSRDGSEAIPCAIAPFTSSRLPVNPPRTAARGPGPCLEAREVNSKVVGQLDSRTDARRGATCVTRCIHVSFIGSTPPCTHATESAKPVAPSMQRRRGTGGPSRPGEGATGRREGGKVSGWVRGDPLRVYRDASPSWPRASRLRGVRRHELRILG
jgi:hypothetical protein